MNVIKRIFREEIASVIFVLGLTVSCFVLVNIINLMGKINLENKTLYNFKYTTFSCIEIYRVDGGAGTSYEERQGVALKLIPILESAKQGNIYIESSIGIDEGDIGCKAHIVMKHNEDVRLNCTSKYDVNTRNGVIIGEDLLEYVNEENGKKIIIFEENAMEVIGVLENNMTGGVDRSAYIFWENCDLEIKNKLEKIIAENIDYLEWVHKSQHNIAEEYRRITENIEKKDAIEELIVINAELPEEYDVVPYQSDTYKKFNTLFLAIGFVFSIFNCFSVSYIWIVSRKKELAIRKAYGYSVIQIAGLLLLDMLKLCVPATIFALIAQGVYASISAEGVMTGEIIVNMLLLAVGMFLVSLISLLNMLKTIKKIAPASVLNES